MYQINGITAYPHSEITASGAWLCQVQTDFGKNWIVINGTLNDYNHARSYLNLEGNNAIQMTWIDNIATYKVKENRFESLVRQMRKAQKNYFASRKKGLPDASIHLENSKRLEKQVDDLLGIFQPQLF